MGKHDINLIYWLSNSGSAISFAFLVILLQERGISKIDIGLLAIPFSLAMIASNTIFGKLSDDRGRRPFLLLGLILSGLTVGLYIFPTDYWSFFIVRALHGLALGIYPASITGAASDCDQKLGSLSSFGALGWATGNLVGGFVAVLTQLDYIFILSSILFFISFVLAIIFKTGNCNREIGNKEKPVNHLNSMDRYKIAIRKNWREYLVVMFRHGTANAIWIYWPLFLKYDLGLTLDQIGIVGVTNTLTQFIVMKTLGDRFNPRKSFIFGSFLSAVAFSLFPLASNFLEIALTQLVLGISFSFFMTGSVRAVEEDNKMDNNNATSNGLLFSSYSSAQVIGPLLAVFLTTIEDSYTLSMNVAAVITLITTVIYAISLKFKKPRRIIFRTR